MERMPRGFDRAGIFWSALVFSRTTYSYQVEEENQATYAMLLRLFMFTSAKRFTLLERTRTYSKHHPHWSTKMELTKTNIYNFLSISNCRPMRHSRLCLQEGEHPWRSHWQARVRHVARGHHFRACPLQHGPDLPRVRRPQHYCYFVCG